MRRQLRVVSWHESEGRGPELRCKLAWLHRRRHHHPCTPPPPPRPPPPPCQNPLSAENAQAGEAEKLATTTMNSCQFLIAAFEVSAAGAGCLLSYRPRPQKPMPRRSVRSACLLAGRPRRWRPNSPAQRRSARDRGPGWGLKELSLNGILCCMSLYK